MSKTREGAWEGEEEEEIKIRKKDIKMCFCNRKYSVLCGLGFVTNVQTKISRLPTSIH